MMAPMGSRHRLTGDLPVIYVGFGKPQELQAFQAAHEGELKTGEAYPVQGVGSLDGTNEPEVVLIGTYAARADWPQIEAELSARKAYVRLEQF
jgi:hypothetical protein